MNVLFVCTLNRARSLAAERMYRGTPGVAVRSAGIDARARHQVTTTDLIWADRIITFEPAHEAWLRNTFTGDLPTIVDVGIPDGVAIDDPRLHAELREVLAAELGPAGRHIRG